MAEQRLYGEFASWWHILSAPEDYAEEAAFFRKVLNEGCESPPKTVLELGSGGGNNASHMKAWFEMTLVDVAPGMLRASREINPELEHVEGDMRSVRLGRLFDAVFVHDAVGYMRTRGDLRRAVRTAALHCRPGGAALFCPDSVVENFRPATRHGGHDGPDGRAIRYLEWTWDPDPDDDAYRVDFAYLLREADGTVRAERDLHICGLFPRAFWLEVLGGEGLEPGILDFEHSEIEPGTHVLFLGRKPAGG